MTDVASKNPPASKASAPADSTKTVSKVSASKMGDMPEMIQLGPPSKAAEGPTQAIPKTAIRVSERKVPEQSKPPRRNSDPDLRRSRKRNDESGDSDFEHISSQEDEDGRIRLRKVSIKSSLPAKAKLTKMNVREERDSLVDDLSYEELKSNYKMMRRESREQHQEIRALEKQNMQLRESFNKIRSELNEDPHRFNKMERNKYVEHFQLMEGHIHWQEHEVAKRNNHIEMLTKQTREANGEREELESTNRKLQQQITELQTNLTECKDDLLRVQPSNQIADSEVGDKFSNLSQQITSWVDDQTEDSEVLEERFGGFVSKESLDIDPILSAHLNDHHLKLVQSHPDSIPLVVQYLVHRCLEQYVMGSGIYFYGLDIRNIGLLREAEAGMKQLEPKRDSITIRRWRSETLAGLSESSDFSEARVQQGHTLAKTLYFALARLLRGPKMEVDDDGWEELHKQIVKPAIELATVMRLSMTDYEVVARSIGDRDMEEAVVLHNEIPHYQMIDSATQKIIRTDSALKLGQDGRIGVELLAVTPALMRTKNDGVHRVIISKPAILVKLDEPMGKRSKGLRPLGSWTPNWMRGEHEAE